VDAAVAADPPLGNRIGVSTFVTDSLRIGAAQLVHEGERLVAKGDREGAHAKFEQAFALNTLFDDYAVPPEAPLYVWIEEGEFMMGSGDEDQLADYDERPLHAVWLDGYWIMRTEVTNEQYKRCVDADECNEPDSVFWDNPQNANKPVVYVDWNQANAYAEFVGGRLPTEAEWEKACRGINGQMFPWGNASPWEPDNPRTDLVNFDMGRVDQPVDVGSYPPGVWGLYDMAGNVWEWTNDLYDETYYSYSPGQNPMGSENGEAQSLRGGSFGSVHDLRCANRQMQPREFSRDYVGFRIVLSEYPQER
jgi:formylglycine-generating enzyme required for sulfatase activity